MINRYLTHPLTRDLNLDDPGTTQLRRQVLESKPLLKKIYQEWYRLLAAAVPVGEGRVLELGSGAGFLPDFVPEIITSEIFFIHNLQMVLNGCDLPFCSSSLKAILFTDVLHHIPDPRRFFGEAARCVRPGGVICMVEPWVSNWSAFVYSNMHHEPFVPKCINWEFASIGPVTSANGALPWIIFQRDRVEFERDFPEWRIERIAPMMPFLYLLSGGISLRSLMPGFSYGFWRWLESALEPFMKHLAMFSVVLLRRRDI